MRKICKTTFAALCAALLLTLFSGCGKTEPNPQPTPEPSPSPEGFVPIVELDATGNLTKIPMPFLDFTAGMAEIDVWENAHGATYMGEQPLSDLMVYAYDTKDPKKLNSTRKYDISDAGKGNLINATAYYKIELLYDTTSQKPVLNEHFKQLLEKEGFKRDANDEIDIYLSKELCLVISPISGTEALIFYSEPKGEPVVPEGFVPIVELDDTGNLTKIPYPFVDFEKGKPEVETWEKAHGAELSQERPNEKDGTTSYTYSTRDPNKVNTLRTYIIGKHGQDKLQTALAVFKSDLFFDLSKENPTLNEHFKALLAAEGYKFLDTGVKTIISYQNEKNMLSFSFVSGMNLAVAIYMPLGGGGENPGGGESEQNYAQMLPNLDFGSSFAKEGPIWVKEKARGFDVEYIEDLEYGNYLRSSPTAKASQTAIKVTSMYYYDKYAGADQTIYRTGVVVFAENLPPNDVKVKEFMKDTGFTLVDEAQNVYENNNLNTRAAFKMLSGVLEMSLEPIKASQAGTHLKRDQLEEISPSFSSLFSNM